MYYDDEARRFNFLSGLVLGAALGAGLALLIAPQDQVRKRGAALRSPRRWKKRASRKLERWRDDMAESVAGMGKYLRA